MADPIQQHSEGLIDLRAPARRRRGVAFHGLGYVAPRSHRLGMVVGDLLEQTVDQPSHGAER